MKGSESRTRIVAYTRTDERERAHTCARMHARTHAHTHPRARARALTHTHTYTFPPPLHTCVLPLLSGWRVALVIQGEKLPWDALPVETG